MTVVLVTRPALSAQRLVDRLRVAGYESMCEPLLGIIALTTPKPILTRQPIIVLTSRTTLSALSDRRDEVADLLGGRCYCVGDQTATEAKAFGFRDVISAQGDGEALATLIIEEAAHDLPILHIGGQDVSAQPALALRAVGREVFHWPVYQARAVTRLSSSCRDRLGVREIDAILFFSVRTAQVFVKCIQDEALEPCCAALTAVGLSEAVVQALAPLPIGRVVIASSPSEEGLLASLSSLSYPIRTRRMSDFIEQEPVPSDKPHVEAPASVQDEAKARVPKREIPWVAVFALVVFLGVGAMYVLSPRINGVALDVMDGSPTAALTSRIDEIEARTKRVEMGLERIANAATTQVPQAQAPAEGQGALTGSTEIEQLKVGLAGLSGALSLLQTELEKTSKVTNEDRINTQAGLATMVAFFQMERVALNGQAFEKDRQMLRKLADSDQVLVDKLISLEPYALQGVSTPMKLLKDWRMKSADAQAAMRKAGAQTWIDRIVVALEGLISIRSVTPGVAESLSFAGISLDLDEGDIQTAVQKADALPPEVQESIKSWLEQAKARLAVETILGAMSAHLIERGAPSELAPAPETAPDAAAQPMTGGT